MQSNGMWYGNDDQDYFANASSLVFGQFPSYEKEFDYGAGDTLGSIGPGLMAAPFVYAFSLIDRATGSNIIYYRTLQNVAGSWAQFGFVFATNVYFWFACFLLYKGLRFHFDDHYASLSVILMVLCQGLPLFAFRRPIFSHVYELFLQSVFVFIFLRNIIIDSFELKTGLYAAGIGILIGLMYIVRYNNIVSAVIWPIVLFGGRLKELSKLKFLQKLAIVYISAFFLIVIFKALPNYYNHHVGYIGYYDMLTRVEPLSFYVKRLAHILAGIDFGLIYTAPFIFVALISFFVKDFSPKNRLFVCLVPMLINLYGVVILKTQGCWYGYRYLIASLMPLLVYPLAFILQKAENDYGYKTNIFLGIIAIFPLLSMLCFEGNGTNLTLKDITQYFGRAGYGNNTYQVEVWKTLLFYPSEFLVAIFKAGPLYIFYLGSLLCGCGLKLMPIVVEKYPIFDSRVAIKIGILYLLPFLLYWITRENNRKAKRQENRSRSNAC